MMDDSQSEMEACVTECSMHILGSFFKDLFSCRENDYTESEFELYQS